MKFTLITTCHLGQVMNIETTDTFPTVTECKVECQIKANEFIRTKCGATFEIIEYETERVLHTSILHDGVYSVISDGGHIP